MYGIFTYIYHKHYPHVGIYTSPMDPMGFWEQEQKKRLRFGKPQVHPSNPKHPGHQQKPSRSSIKTIQVINKKYTVYININIIYIYRGEGGVGSLDHIYTCWDANSNFSDTLATRNTGRNQGNSQVLGNSQVVRKIWAKPKQNLHQSNAQFAMHLRCTLG